MTRRLGMLVLVACFAVALLTGCADTGPVWVDEDAAYTASTISMVFGQADDAEFVGKPTNDSEDLRHDALVALRARGGAAAEAADLITKTFPSTAGVPLYVERASFEGSSNALIVVEIIGPTDGDLSLSRLWVLSETGDVLYSASE